MKKLWILGAIASFAMLQNAFCTQRNTTKVIVPDYAIITGINAQATIKLDALDMQEAIAKNDTLNTDVIATACMYTTHAKGDYDLSIKVDGKYKIGSNFALYSSRLGKIKAKLLVSSNEDKNLRPLHPNKATPLKDHSDIDAKGSNCKNKVQFSLSIHPTDLRKAKAGEYTFCFSASTSPFSG